MGMHAINKAIDQAGGLTGLAEQLGCTPQVIVNWRTRGIPAARVRAVVAAVKQAGGDVTAHDLRPDLYPAGFEFPVDGEPATYGQAA